MSEMIKVSFTLNGKPVTYNVAAQTSLLRMLRDNYNYDVKCGCEEGDCGTCTVLVDGVSHKSCITLAAQVEGKSVLTVRGITYGDDEAGHLLQKNFVECGSIQCGFCTPGLIMVSKEYLNNGGIADRSAIRRAISGNLCRCTGYKKIIDAVYKTAKEIGREERQNV
ncbi:MAG: (2Fe-2S)-binding protein [Clostridiales bacterium]|jgi:carbon-monoxide dehydrogenase small subunit|nr:(2Fe-2S)-binding protein [Clostridiales bacterium]